MPAIQVARTDTFDIQRQKINQIGDQIFSISQGGSDLATGNLKIGDGSKNIPSLAFTNDTSVGIYRPQQYSLGFASNSKILGDFTPDSFISYKNFNLKRKSLFTAGLEDTATGENYDPGVYSSLSLSGGTGEKSEVNITITEFTGTILDSGYGYNAGTYSDILMSGGSGTEARATFTISGIEGTTTNPGSGYVPGTYLNVPLINGSGSDATGDFEITGEEILSGTITNSGSGYTNGTYPSLPVYNIPLSTFAVTVDANPGTPPPDNVFLINGVSQDTLTLVKGNTYWFDISDASNQGHPFILESALGQSLSITDYIISTVGSSGSAGSFVQLVIKPGAPTETIRYDCAIHDQMGGTISIVDGVSGNYGTSLRADVTVSGGLVTQVDIVSNGNSYKSGDTLTLAAFDIGPGSNFVYTMAAPVYTGTVLSFTINNNGVNYVSGDVLSVSDSNVGNGGGSGFAFTVSNNPSQVSSFIFSSKGTGYQVGDILTIPESVTNISATLVGEIALTASIVSGSPIITVPSTDGITNGMNVQQPSFITDVGKIAFGATVIDVNPATNEVTLSANSTATGAGDLVFSSQGNYDEITIASVAGIRQGYSVVVTSGPGDLPDGTTVAGVNALTNTILLSEETLVPGAVTLTFVPPWGDPTSTDFSYEIEKLGVLSDYLVSYGGLGYSVDDELTVNSADLTQPIEYPVIVKEVSLLTLTSTIPDSTFSVGDNIKKRAGNIISVNVTTDPNTISTGVYNNISGVGGSGSGAVFDIVALPTGIIGSVTVVNSGFYYEDGDTITIPGTSLGGSSPTDDVVLTVTSVESSTDLEIFSKEVSGGNIVSLTVEYDSNISDGDFIIKSGTTSPAYELNSVSPQEYRYFIDIGGGYVQNPNLTLYVNNTYKFDFSDASNSLHEFAFSKFRDGVWSPSVITGVNATITGSSKDIVVDNTTGILVGMEIISGLGTGSISSNTFVESINGNVITISQEPSSPGIVELSFKGVEYTDNVTKSSDSVLIKITDTTPNLYYYCVNHPNMGGHDNNEALLTVDPNNPKVFGSGILFTVTDLEETNVVSNNVETGELQSISIISEDATFTDVEVSGTLTSPNIIGNAIIASTITAVSNQNIAFVATSSNFNSNLNVGTSLQIQKISGNLTTSGYLKTLNSLNVNDYISITNNIISSETGIDIVLQPSANRVAKVNATSALVIPVGTTLERPGESIRQNGSIRFNTETSQYEGYNNSTASWSSLGGVRDIDGNTYILAELTAGANDNTLWFYNDNNNTLRLNTEFLDFRTVKKISSGRLGLPAFTRWAANSPVSVGQFLKYRNNLYEVTGAGTTATSGSEPTHTSGVVNNGTAQLTWYSSAVSSLSFTEVEEVRIAPDKDAPLVVNSSLKFGGITSDDWNTISTLLEDLTIAPNPGKKVVIKAYTHLAIPAGNNNQKNTASAVPGSIRFNTEIQQFEGYSGTNWSSLGGVRDVDGNTYIIPETAPAANENILYFYNDNLNTMQLTKTSLDFTNIDTITTSGLNNLSIDTPLVTLNSNDTTIDNRDVDRTFISTSKQFLDLGLSSGLVVDPVLRLDDQGDVYLNTTFGSGTFSGVKVLDSQLKEFELADYAIKTTTFQLAKGGAESGSFVLYDSVLRKGCKVTVVSKSSSGKRSMTEYSVIDNGTDIFHSEFGSLNTSLDQYTASFDFNATNETRISLTLSNDHANGDIITFTILVQVIK